MIRNGEIEKTEETEEMRIRAKEKDTRKIKVFGLHPGNIEKPKGDDWAAMQTLTCANYVEGHFALQRLIKQCCSCRWRNACGQGSGGTSPP